MQCKSFPQLLAELLAFPEQDLGTILLAAEHPRKVLSIFTPRTTKIAQALPESGLYGRFPVCLQDFFFSPQQTFYLSTVIHLGSFPYSCVPVSNQSYIWMILCIEKYIPGLSLYFTVTELNTVLI